MKPAAKPLLGAGLLLIGVCWPLNWLLPGLRTHLLFFPLWLGYILVVDGWTLARTGTSPLARSPARFALLFLVSMPFWWLFELLNLRLQNWEYVGREHFTDLEYFLLSSLSFSTVAPAVFGSAEFMASFRPFERFAHGPVLRPTTTLCAALFALGLLMLAAMLAWPVYFYPFAWTSFVFMLEPLCVWLGRRSFLSDLRDGDWRRWMTLWAGGLLCGFFWEMWNVWSYPKWVYHVPGVDFWKVFEMPLLGYLGYLPFAMELYLLRQLLSPPKE